MMLSMISEPSEVENLIWWCTDTKQNGMRVLEARAVSAAADAVGWFVQAMKSARAS
jgi:hypothetical protein